MSAKARTGTFSGGGGSVERASFSEIKSAINLIFAEQSLRDNYWKIAYQVDSLADSETKKLFNNMVHGNDCKHDPINLVRDGLGTKHYFKNSGACHGIDGDQQASVESNTHYSPICFSLELISKAFPKANLVENLNTLVMHEIAHHCGANESLAKVVETFFASVQSKDYAIFVPFHTAYLDTGNSLRTLGHQIEANPETLQSDICFTIGRLQGLIVSLDLFSSRMPDEVIAVAQAASFLNKRLSDVVGFCYLTPKGRNQRDNGFTYPKVGDRDALKANLNAAKDQYDNLGWCIKNTIGYQPYDPSQDPFNDPIEDKRP